MNTVRARYVAANLVKNAAAPAARRLRPGGGSYGMDNDAGAVATMLDELSPGIRPLDLRAATVVELGPGRTWGVCAALAALGAERALALDVELRVAPPGPDEVRAMLAGLAAHTPSALGPATRTAAEATAALDLRAFDGVHIPLGDGRAQLTFSKSVLEHVRASDVTGLLGELRRVTAPGGRGVHVIDLRDHMWIDGDERETGDWLDALRYPEPLFDAMFSRRSTYINRLRAGEWRAEFAGAGFEIVRWSEDRRGLPADFERGRLHPRWRDLSEDELRVGYVTVEVRAPL